MNISTREQQYEQLRQAWLAGQIDEAAFTAAVDGLGFQDAQGCRWMMGVETGRWYYFEGQSWQAANPQPLPVAPATEQYGPAMPRFNLLALLARPAKALLAVGLALIFILALVWPVGNARTLNGPQLAPSPRPPLGGGNGDDDDSGSGSGSDTTRSSSIQGKLLDVSTGQSGAGIEISVNGSLVRTDTDGSYSITGLPAGNYSVQPQLMGQGIPIQGPVFVNLDGHSSVIVDLTYTSQSAPQPTDTPLPIAIPAAVGLNPAAPAANPPIAPATVQAVQATPPPALPSSGGDISQRPPLLLALGLIVAFMGGLLWLVTSSQKAHGIQTSSADLNLER